MILDLYLVYSFIKRLTKPFYEWPAYKLGIIDEDGTVLRKRNTLRTAEEKDAFGIFDLMILNIKKTLAKLPGGATKIASYAAALYLIKEWKHFSSESILTEDISDFDIEKHVNNFLEMYITEDVAVGSGAIAGLGVGPQGEPPVKKTFGDYTKMLKRKKLLEEPKILGAPKKMNDILAGEPTGEEKARIRKNKKHARPTVRLI